MRICLPLALALAALPAAARAGAIEGRVTTTQKASKKTLPVTQDHGVCGKKGVEDESLLVSGDGGLANAVVSLEGAPASAGKPAEVHLDQKACRFIPHVQSATQGAKLVILNNDKVLHNVHAFRGQDTAFNVALPTAPLRNQQTLKEPGLMSMKCDAGHSWMSAYIAVFPHAHHTVTGKDGKFTLPDVPPGKYKLRTWHEKLGEKSVDVTVGGDKATANVAY